MVLDRETGTIEHRMFSELPELLPANALLIVNNSRVRKSRFIAESLPSGGKVEFLLLEQESPVVWQAVVSKAKKQRAGKTYRFPGGRTARILPDSKNEQANREIKRVEFDAPAGEDYLESYGSVPLPPYIRRNAETSDEKRYQTVFAELPGSAAAPTAGLHFTPQVLEHIRKRGIEVREITLHVGLGTFRPIRSDEVESHRMHEEAYTVPEAAAEAINRAKSDGRPIIAVGTTVVRTLESAAQKGDRIRAETGKTELFIQPGHDFLIVDHLITNFHTPRSSLLVLVSAFAGRERILEAYSTAVKQEYRFFSYGDAMYIR